MRKEMNPSLRRYVPLMDMLGAVFGEDCELVLHDLREPEHSVVYVVHGQVTGREVGQGIEHLVREVMSAGPLTQDYAVNDYFRKKGKLIRSSSLFIRDDEGKLIGALCLNLDTTKITQQLEFLKSFLPETPQPEPAAPKERKRVEDMVMSLVDHILDGCDVRLLSREERIDKIRFMDQRGIFQVKGSIDQVAERLGINRVTVYSYLDEVHKKDKVSE